MSPRALEAAALRYLARYATSAANLRRVLMRAIERSARAHDTDRADGAAWVEALIGRYQAAGLLDDAAYARAKAASLRRRGASGRAVRAALAAKGVARDVIAAVLAAEEGAAGGAELRAAAALARRRRLGPYRPAAERAARRQHDLAAFWRAGFSLGVARRVVEADSAEALEAETG